MSEKNGIELHLPQEKQEEAAEVLQLVSGMSADDQRGLLAFMRGVAFGRQCMTGQN